MNKLAKIIDEMPLEDLKKLKLDFEKGTLHTLLQKKLREKEEETVSLCPVCSTPVKRNEGFYLEFGSLRKKAVFDGIDCLEYFIHRLKKP